MNGKVERLWWRQRHPGYPAYQFQNWRHLAKRSKALDSVRDVFADWDPMGIHRHQTSIWREYVCFNWFFQAWDLSKSKKGRKKSLNGCNAHGDGGGV